MGAEGLVLLEDSDVAEVKMRLFNTDGSEGLIGGNAIRCVAKYLYDKGFTRQESFSVETGGGVRHLDLYTVDGKVTSVAVDMGKASLKAADLPTTLQEESLINYPVEIGGEHYNITCVSVGNPHCVVFCDRVDGVDVAQVGPRFEHSELFPERINTEFVRVVNPLTIKMRVWERGSGETTACGTGACAAVVAAVATGQCEKGTDVTVKLRGGDLTVNYTDKRVILTGDAKLLFDGTTEY